MGKMARRMFLGLALTVPLVGCGGGWQLGLGPVRGGGNDGGSSAVGRATVTVNHGSLAGALPGYEDLRVATAFGAERPSVTGQASVLTILADTTLAFTTNSAGKILYYGWLSPTRTTLSATTTAEVLLYYALGAYLMPPEIQERVLGIIANSDSVRSRLAPAVVSFLRANSAGLSGDTTSLMTLVAAEVAALLPAVGGGTRGVAIQNPGARSGVEAVQSSEPNTVLIQNQYLRRAVLAVNQVGYTDASGKQQTIAAQQIALSEISLPKAADSFANTVSAWIEAYYSNKTFGDGSIDAGIFRSESDKVSLQLTPATAKKTHYRAHVLMPGLVADPALLAKLLPAQREYIDGINLKNLYIRLFFEDLIAPYFLSFVAKKLAGDRAFIETLTGELLKVMQEVLPGQIELLASGRRSAYDVFKQVLKSMTVDPATGATSETFRKIVVVILTKVAARFGGINSELFLQNVSQGLNINGTVVPGVGRLVAILGAADKILGYANTARIVADAARSRQVEFWDIDVNGVKIALDPTEIIAEHGAAVPGVKVNLQGSQPGEGQFFSYKWSCTSGRIADGKHPIANLIASTTVDSVSYQAEGAAGTTDEVVVEVTLKGPGRTDSQVLGTAKAKAYITGLSVSPTSKTLKAEETVTLTTELKGMRPLKPGEKVSYKWLTTRNAGELVGSADGGTTIPVETPTATYRAHITKQGTDTVTVEASLGTTRLGSAKAAIKVGNAEPYVIESFSVDDNMTLWHNGKVISMDSDGAYAGNRGPFTLKDAKKGDSVRLQIRDWYGYYAGNSDVFIRRPDGTQRLWLKSYQTQTPGGTKKIVVDATTTLD